MRESVDSRWRCGECAGCGQVKTMSEKMPVDRCPSCNRSYTDHPGLIGTCRQNNQARQSLRVIRTWATWVKQHGDMPHPMDFATLVVDLTDKTLWTGEDATMQEILTKIKAAMDEFETDATKRIDGNKAAGVRSRHKSMEIAKLLKAWRDVSKAE